MDDPISPDLISPDPIGLDLIGPGTIVGYCTNVHAGATYEQVLTNLGRYSVAVQQQICPDGPLGISLWLAAPVAKQIIQQDRVRAMADWLHERGLVVFTLNGFPYHDFHQPVVKHRVYHPDWRQPDRLRYTIDLITILAGLRTHRPTDSHHPEGSISTLPVAWANEGDNGCDGIEDALSNLIQAVDHLAHLEQTTGQLIHLDLEPEPGCVLQRSRDVVELFTQHLDRVGQAGRVRRHLRVCHDVCHTAVVFEDQATVLDTYRKHGIQVGKVQISSAIHVPMDRLDLTEQARAMTELEPFAEDRYLHQTTIQDARDPRHLVCFEDLPQALRAWRAGGVPPGPWRVHYHVPLFLDRVGLLETTHGQIRQCLSECRGDARPRHFEIETYAWGVIPATLRKTPLAQGIAREFAWLKTHWPARGPG